MISKSEKLSKVSCNESRLYERNRSSTCKSYYEKHYDIRKYVSFFGRIRPNDIVLVVSSNNKGRYKVRKVINQSNTKSKMINYVVKAKNDAPLLKENNPLFNAQLKIADDEHDSDTPFFKIPISRISSEDMLSNQIASTIRVNTTMNEYAMNENTLKKVKGLRYREEVFMAASKLVKDMPPYAPWSHMNEQIKINDIRKINIGGEIFEIFHSTADNMCYSKIGRLMDECTTNNIPFIDRDPVCFNAILNLYRTGRLHVPPNICLTFFEEELEFWGINEDFMEACCWGDFNTSKIASNKLKKYSEDSDKSMEKYMQESTGRISDLNRELFKIMTSGSGNPMAMWVALLCAFFIIFGIIEMVFSTTPIGRIDIKTGRITQYKSDESVTEFLTRTNVSPDIEMFDYITSGFFTAELLLRFLVSPIKLEFFRDTFNWIDIVATVTALVEAVTVREQTHGKLEAYTMILKIPRIFRLLKLTQNLRSGIDAFVLTIIASANELQLVFFLLLLVTVLFACVLLSVEMMDPESTITSLYVGMWWAIETMPGVGYGDYIPATVFGRIIGASCIMVGIIVCQMPVPVFLKNFSIYYNQASARLVSQNDLLLCQHVDKSDIYKYEKEIENERKKTVK